MQQVSVDEMVVFWRTSVRMNNELPKQPALAVIGSASWGPSAARIFTPPPMNIGERGLHAIGRLICAIAYPVEMFGESIMQRASSRVNAIARLEVERAFGRPGKAVLQEDHSAR